MLVKIQLKKHTRWLVLACIGIGALGAFPVVAQFFAAKLLEPVASLWGAALGAFAGIAGAFWVAERQAASQRRAAAALVRQIFHPVAFALEELAFVLGPPSRPHRGDSDEEPDIFDHEKWTEVTDQAGFVLDHYRKFTSRIHRYEAGLNLLSASSLSAALALESELDDIIDTTVTRLKMMPKEGNFLRGEVAYPAKAPTWSSRFAIAVSNGHVQESMAKLERDAS